MLIIATLEMVSLSLKVLQFCREVIGTLKRFKSNTVLLNAILIIFVLLFSILRQADRVEISPLQLTAVINAI